MADDDELFQYLPRLLRVRPFLTFLLPRPTTAEKDRPLYPMRMTTVMVSIGLFCAQAIVFGMLGHSSTARFAVGGGCCIGLAVLLLRRNFPQAGLSLGLGTVFCYLGVLQWTYGLACSAWLIIFPVTLASFFVYSRDEWRLRLVPLGLCLGACALVVLPIQTAPQQVLSASEARVLLTMHAVGSLYATLVLGSHAAAFREAATLRIGAERDRADGLLLNILPASIAARLMRSPATIVDDFPHVSVLFADVVGFTRLSGTLASAKLVELLGGLFCEFDALAARHGLEKIKTIGDAYMVAGGLPEPCEDHAARAVKMALEMHTAVASFARSSGHPLALRIGINSGPVTAGVIGKNKFAYDLWGDTVNVASRMESHGEPGKIQVTQSVFEQLKDRYPFVERGEIEVKGKGPMRTWLL